MQTGAPWYRILLLTLAGVLLLAGIAVFLYEVRGILPPFLIAFAVAWLLDPLLDRIQRMGCSRIMAITGVYALFLGVFLLGLTYLVPTIVNQADQLSSNFGDYAKHFKDSAQTVMQAHKSLLIRLNLPPTVEGILHRYGGQLSKSSTSGVSSGLLLVGNWVGANASKALWVILIPLISFYLLNDFDRMRKRSVLFIPEQWRERTIEISSKVGSVFSSYVRGLLLACILYGILEMVLLTSLRVNYAVILGLLAGVLYAVPYVGAGATVLIIFLVSLATYQTGVSHPVWLAPVCAVGLNLVFDNGVTPKILGKAVGLHPVLSMFALLAGGQLFGLAGMVLSVPVAASIQEILFEFRPDLRPEPHTKKPKAKPKSAPA